jgi:hypothetical protein
MTLYPDIQKKLQSELDAALQGRLPEDEDLENIPYLLAVVYEVHRYVSK